MSDALEKTCSLDGWAEEKVGVNSRQLSDTATNFLHELQAVKNSLIADEVQSIVRQRVNSDDLSEDPRQSNADSKHSPEPALHHYIAPPSSSV